MPAKNSPGSSEPDLPDQGGRNAKRGEIEALLESPELRRIFNEEPARVRSGRAGHKAADRLAAEPEEGRVRRSPRSRRRRILVGLAPLYLAGVILFFETVREPSVLLQAFGTPSVAEETPSRAGAAVVAAAAPEEKNEGEMRAEMRPVATTPEDDRTPPVATAPDPKRVEKTATKIAVADARPGLGAGKSAIFEKSVTIEKAAADLAKRVPDDAIPALAVAERQTPHPDLPTAGAIPGSTVSAPTDGMGETPMVVFPSDPDVADFPSPDSAAGATAIPEPMDPAAAEATEQALSLSRSDRREVQRRLRFASADPQAIDGIFGPATRSAIAEWQEKAGLQATGFMDGPGMALLVEQTADEYRAWRQAARARAREREREAESAVVATSALPVPRGSREETCRRMASGEIAFGQDVGCNFQAFSENLKNDFRNLKGDLRALFD